MRVEKTLKPQASIKRFKKSEREMRVLFGLINLYLKTLKPVGSNNLRENGFEDLSSATIRNYFAGLENSGLLEQPHTSGGRIPTWRAFKLFATESKTKTLPKPIEMGLKRIGQTKTKKIFELLQKATEELSQWTGGAAFITMPHFEQDSIIDMHLISIDAGRLLGVLVTSFGLVHTHTLLIDHKLSEHAIRRIEGCLKSQLIRTSFPQKLSSNELKIAEHVYQELLTRYLVNQSSFFDSGTYKTGLARLLKHPEFHESKDVAGALELFENPENLTHFAKAALASNAVHSWIGEELSLFTSEPSKCSICTVHYTINHIPVGSIGVLLPLSSDYSSIFTLLDALQKSLTQALETNIYTYKLSYSPSGLKSKPFLLDHIPMTIEHKADYE